ERLGAAVHGLFGRGVVDAGDDTQPLHASASAENPRFEVVGATPLVELRAFSVADEAAVEIATVWRQPEAVPTTEPARLLLRVEPGAGLLPDSKRVVLLPRSGAGGSDEQQCFLVCHGSLLGWSRFENGRALAILKSVSMGL